jgi:CheY-like chemotaxis protein
MALSKPILVVDDDPVSCLLITEILTEQGYDAEWTTSTAAALESISQRDYRLVVTDVFMPGVGGTVLAWHLRQLRPALPILLITAFPSRTTEADARALGVPLLAKPFVPNDLIERVGKLVSNGSGGNGDQSA